MIESVTFLHPEGRSTCESLRCNPAMHSASLPFQNAELPVRALLGSCCQHSPTHSNKGYCLLTHRLSLNETGAICRFINYTLSHTTSLSAEQREGERGLPFLLYINVRLQPRWLQLASLAQSVLPRDMRLIIMKWGKKWHWCQRVHAVTLNFMQDSWPWNWSNWLRIFMIVTCLFLNSWFQVLLCRGRFGMSFKMSSVSSRQPNAPVQLVWRVILESSSQYYLALMSNWNISGCLPCNVILFCILGTLEDKTL